MKLFSNFYCTHDYVWNTLTLRRSQIESFSITTSMKINFSKVRTRASACMCVCVVSEVMCGKERGQYSSVSGRWTAGEAVSD